jgi:hypothetical protein
MSLYSDLQQAKSEEDVKDAYVKALGLKSVTKGLIDIQTDDIWFEAKDTGKHSSYAMFTQLLHYVQFALNKGEKAPPFLAVIDTQKAALMKTSDVLPFLEKKTVKWGKSASKYTQEALDEISAHIGTHFVSFNISTHEDEFIATVKAAIKTGDIIRTQITPDNLKQVFDKWVDMVGREIVGIPEEKYALLFFADIMHDGTVSTHQNLSAELLHKNGKPVFFLDGKLYELGSREGYRRFWAIYHKPPKQEYRNYLLERRDSLIPLNERSFKGAFYTPLHVVDKAYDKISQILGKNWQRDYVVWDMCCGVGNLEVKHGNPRNIFMSTLDQEDVDVMMATKTCVSAERFQYDYLNDDINEKGEIDYTLTNKIPSALKAAISEKKKLFILINPPYAEAMNVDNVTSSGGVNAEDKKGVSKTKVASNMNNFGYATRELFTQFLTRIAKEMPTAFLGMFSTLKYVNSPNFEKFRESWNAKYLDGFLVHSQAFDGLSGDFPIAFLVWKTDQLASVKRPIVSISAEVLNKKAEPIGEKEIVNQPSARFLTNWIVRPKPNKTPAVPLKNATTPATSSKDPRGKWWVDDGIGSFMAKGNDMQNAPSQTALFSSGYGSAGAMFVTKQNIDEVAVMFSVRMLIKHTWINHNDQFMQPCKSLSEEFVADCLVWMLFHGKNLSASADGLVWGGQKWSIDNHFIPFTENEVGAPSRFASDFMSQHLKIKRLSVEASLVLAEGRKIWSKYFMNIDARKVREELFLNRSDVGWYQIRKALALRDANNDSPPTNFSSFNAAYKALSAKLIPFVYDYEFLPRPNMA